MPEDIRVLDRTAVGVFLALEAVAGTCASSIVSFVAYEVVEQVVEVASVWQLLFVAASTPLR